MDAQEILSKVGEWASEEGISRGAALAGAGVLALAAWVWRRLRGKPKPDRVNVVVDAPPGEQVSIRVGHWRPGPGDL